MPKVRQLEPEFWDDQDVAKLTLPERLLAVAMITLLADDEGRFLADPVVIRKKVFGYDRISVEAVAEMLRHISEKCRNFQKYSVDGHDYMVLLHFAKKQGIRYVVKSKLPPPVSSTESGTAEICGNLPEVAEVSCRVEKSRVEESSASDDPGEAFFAELWSQYPRRIGRKDAEKHFRASVKTPQDRLDIAQALTAAKVEFAKRDPSYIPHGSTWFNNWRDYVSLKANAPPVIPQVIPETVRLLADFDRKRKETHGTDEQAASS